MTTPPVGRTYPGLTLAAKALVVSSSAGALLCLTAAGFGCWVIASDLSMEGEEWDGLGLFLGGLLLLVATVLGVVCWAVRRGTTHGLRTLRRDGHARALVPTSLVAAGVGWFVTAYVTSDMDRDPTFLVVCSAAVAMALSGTSTLVLSLGAVWTATSRRADPEG